MLYACSVPGFHFLIGVPAALILKHWPPGRGLDDGLLDPEGPVHTCEPTEPACRFTSNACTYNDGDAPSLSLAANEPDVAHRDRHHPTLHRQSCTPSVSTSYVGVVPTKPVRKPPKTDITTRLPTVPTGRTVE